MTMANEELLTLVTFYDTNENTDKYILKIETLLRKLDCTQGIMIGGDWNIYTDRIYDQRGNAARPHYRTKATKLHLEWKDNHKFLMTEDLCIDNISFKHTRDHV